MLSVPEKILLLVLIAATAYFFMVRAKYLISLLKLGQPDNRSDNPNERLSFVLGKVLKQRCVLDNVTSKDYAGIGHMLLFYGFSFFVISYGFHIAEGMYEKLSPALFGTVFNNVFFFLLDVAGLVVIASLIWAAVRRYIIRPERLEPTMEAGIIIIVVFSLMILNYCVEGFRLLAEEEPFANSVFVGKAFAQLFAGMGLQTSAPVLFPLFWWLHLLVVFGFGVYILYSKHLHVLASHPNLYFHSTRPKG
nr:hypothetical protein [Deltaproteobacteria bacterium]